MKTVDVPVLGGQRSVILRQLRWSKGVSMEQCADVIGVSVRQFLKKECGRERLTAGEFDRIALFLDLDAPRLRKILSQGVAPGAGNRAGPVRASRAVRR